MQRRKACCEARLKQEVNIKRYLPETTFAIITLFCCAVAFSCFFKSHVIDKDNGRTMGKIIRLENNGDTFKGGSGSVYPVVHFKTEAGQEIEQRSKVEYNAIRFKEGDSVPVVYDKKDPLVWQINNWWEMYVLPIIFGTVGIILGAFTLIKIIFKIKQMATSSNSISSSSQS